MYCAVCYTMLDKSNSPKLPCGCTNCSDCLTNWIITQTKELHFQTYEKIPCMNSYCKQPFKAEEVSSQLNEEQQVSINEALLDVYLKKTEDIRRCPNSACTYAGTIDTSSPCEDSLECEVCATRWREKVHLSTREKVKDFFYEGNTKRSEFLCGLWEEMWTRRCPSCDVSIEKNGGCDHMTCRKCQFEFCWLCTQKHQNHSRKFCAASIATKIAILCLAFVNILWMIGILQLSYAVFVRIIDFLLKSVILNALAVGSYFFLTTLRKRKRGILLMLVVLIVGLLVVINYFNLYMSLIKVASVELTFLGMLSLYERNMKTWLYGVF